MQVGDKVVVKEGLINNMHYGTNTAVREMIKHGGKIATITGMSRLQEFYVDLDMGRYNWTPEMVVRIKTNDK